MAGVVRADTVEQACEVSELLDDLDPRVSALLPGLRERDLEVWVQPSPHLYPFATTAYQEADGFWAQGAGRIHLKESAESLSRTLAHELVHARLDESWDRLPGTIEEGLCDWVSAELCPEDASYMRAGRLSAAGFALGGLELEIAVLRARSEHPLGIEVGYTARVLLHGEMDAPIDPCSVFGVRAGLSTTRMEPAHKKALYGLAFLVVDRIAEREGIDSLHRMCARARTEGLREIPSEWLLAAAGMTGAGIDEWRAALRERLTDADLAELLGMYPTLLLETLDQAFGAPAFAAGSSAPARVSIALRQGRAKLELALADE